MLRLSVHYSCTLFIDFIISLIVGSVSSGLFVIIQRHVAVPLVDLKVMSHKVKYSDNISSLSFGIFQYLIFQIVPILGPSLTSIGVFGLDAIGVGILQLPFSIAIVILGPIAGIIAEKDGATKLLIPSALTILLLFILLAFLHSTPEQVGINLIFFGIGSGLFVTLDAIIILFIPKDIMGICCSYEYRENYRWCNKAYNIWCHNVDILSTWNSKSRRAINS